MWAAWPVLAQGPARPTGSGSQRGGGPMASPPASLAPDLDAAVTLGLALADRVCSSPDKSTKGLFSEKPRAVETGPPPSLQSAFGFAGPAWSGEKLEPVTLPFVQDLSFPSTGPGGSDAPGKLWGSIHTRRVVVSAKFHLCKGKRQNKTKKTCFRLHLWN